MVQGELNMSSGCGVETFLSRILKKGSRNCRKIKELILLFEKNQKDSFISFQKETNQRKFY